MATDDESNEYGEVASTSSSHLGKRKRSSSPKLLVMGNGDVDHSFHLALPKLLKIARNYDSNPSLLKYPLPAEPSPNPTSKKTRLSSPGHGKGSPESIEHRMASGTYKSVQALLEDIERARDGIIRDVDGVASKNGPQLDKSRESEVKDQISKLITVLSTHQDLSKDVVKGEVEDIEGVEDSAKFTSDAVSQQILCLRTQTERGPQQLFSGLQLLPNSPEIKLAEIDGRKLPNGFELTDPTILEPSSSVRTKDRRIFGDVFRAHRNSKPLELPRPSRFNSRSTALEFISESASESSRSLNPQDYRRTPLPTGSWLHYPESNTSGSESKRKQIDRPQSSSDDPSNSKALREQNEQKAKKMFADAYSSFAPAFDNSKAVFSANDRSRWWWHQHGEKAISTVFTSAYTEEEAEGSVAVSLQTKVDEFQDVVTSFEPETLTEGKEQPDSIQDLDDVLKQISDLVESLNSYQTIRNLKIRKSIEDSKPPAEETDIYELLVAQLSILVDSLPPFAVARLDGDQLRALNISTQIQLNTPDYQGTGQADDYTLRRIRAAQAATSAASRTAPPSQIRPQYQNPPSNNSIYNTNTQNRVAYNANAGLGTAYTPRPAPYQTPRPSTTPQRPYVQPSYQQTNSSYGGQSNPQQFSRPLQNGYPSHASTPSQNQYTPYAPQPAYQQRTQDNATNYGRTVSPSKPMVNGHGPEQYSNQQYQQPTQQSYTPVQANATITQQTPVDQSKVHTLSQGNHTPGPRTTGSIDSTYASSLNQRSSSEVVSGRPQPQPVEAMQ